MGRFNSSLCGTRGAATNWQHEFIEVMQTHGFTNGSASPCNSHHEARKLSGIVHSDGFTSIGTREQLKWLEPIIGNAYECKHQWLVIGEDGATSISLSNRAMTWIEDAIADGAGQRHVEGILERF